MPIYEYRCSACGHQDVYLQKLSEPALTQCPVCGKASLQKLLSAAGFQLKGSGWYATDFKGSGKKKPEEKKPEQKESKTETKPDAKPETKPETKSEAPA
jgi:putative FmdB family regulatory protein